MVLIQSRHRHRCIVTVLIGSFWRFSSASFGEAALSLVNLLCTLPLPASVENEHGHGGGNGQEQSSDLDLLPVIFDDFCVSHRPPYHTISTETGTLIESLGKIRREMGVPLNRDLKVSDVNDKCRSCLGTLIYRQQAEQA